MIVPRVKTPLAVQLTDMKARTPASSTRLTRPGKGKPHHPALFVILHPSVCFPDHKQLRPGRPARPGREGRTPARSGIGAQPRPTSIKLPFASIRFHQTSISFQRIERAGSRIECRPARNLEPEPDAGRRREMKPRGSSRRDLEPERKSAEGPSTW